MLPNGWWDVNRVAYLTKHEYPARIAVAGRIVPGAQSCARGFFVSGVVVMRPSRGDGYLTTSEAARFAGVSVNTIYSWRNRGRLVAQGLDERNRPLHTREAVRAAEKLVRANGIQASGVDPRQLRSPALTTAA